MGVIFIAKSEATLERAHAIHLNLSLFGMMGGGSIY